MTFPTNCTDKKISQICALVREGDRPEVAAGVCDVGRTTYFEWMNRGGKGEEPFASFRTQVARALDEFESRSRSIILAGDEKGAGFGPAKAALEVLSRRMPRHWAQQVRHHVEKVEDEFLDVLQSVCSDPAIYSRLREEKDCSFIFEAFCAALSSIESEGETGETPGE